MASLSITPEMINELMSAYVLDEDGHKLYVWSHIQKVRYNANMTLEDKLKEINKTLNDLDSKINITADTIINALGYNPVNPNENNVFNGETQFNGNIALFGDKNSENTSLFKPLYDTDGKTVIGHILE